MKSFRIFAILLMLVAAVGAHSQQMLTPEQARSRLSAMPLHDIEGIWQLTAVDATVAIWRERLDDSKYTIVLLSAADKRYRPGTVIGSLKPTAKAHTFDAELMTSVNRDGHPGTPKQFTASLDGGGGSRLSFRKTHNGPVVSPRLALSWLVRINVTYRNDRDPSLDGCIKLFPETPIAGQPRYL